MKKLYSLLLLAILGTLVAPATTTVNAVFNGVDLMTVTLNGEVQTVTEGGSYTYSLPTWDDVLLIQPNADNVNLTCYNIDIDYGYSQDYISFEGYDSDYEEVYNVVITASVLEEKTMTITTDAPDTFGYYLNYEYDYSTVPQMTEAETTITYLPKGDAFLVIQPNSYSRFYKVVVNGTYEVAYSSSSYRYTIYLDEIHSEQYGGFVETVEVLTQFPADYKNTIKFEYYKNVNYQYVAFEETPTDIITSVLVNGEQVEMADNTIQLTPGSTLDVGINTEKYELYCIKPTNTWSPYVGELDENGFANLGTISDDYTLMVIVEVVVPTEEKTITLTTDVVGKFKYSIYDNYNYEYVIEPTLMTETSVTIPYEYPKKRYQFQIEPVDGNPFYKVMVNDVYEASFRYGQYYFFIDDSSLSDYDYKPVEKIEVTTEFPADLTYDITFSSFQDFDPDNYSYTPFDGADVFTAYYVDGEQVEPVDGKFTVHAGSKFKVGFNADVYKLISMQAGSVYLSQYSLDEENNLDVGSVITDLDFAVTVQRLVPVTFTLKLDIDPSLLKVAINNTELTGLALGDNTVNAVAGDYIYFYPSGCEFTSITFNGEEKLYTIPNPNTYSTVIPRDIETVVVQANEIIRDMPFTLYVSGLDKPYYWNTQFSMASSYEFEVADGYNTIYTRDEDGTLDFVAYFDETDNVSMAAYQNDVPVSCIYSYFYQEFMPEVNDVIKIFFYDPDNDIVPEQYKVTFNTVGDAGVTAIKDRTVKVDVANGTTEIASGYTEWSISTDSPVAVDGEALVAVDGTYTFVTTAAATVTVGSTTSGIDDLNADGAARGPIYNLQGIRLADDAAKAANLPAGIYIVNGQKVAIR